MTIMLKVATILFCSRILIINVSVDHMYTFNICNLISIVSHDVV